MENNSIHSSTDSFSDCDSSDENPLKVEPKRKYVRKKEHVLSENQKENLLKGRQARLLQCKKIRDTKAIHKNVENELKEQKRVYRKKQIDGILRKLDEEESTPEVPPTPPTRNFCFL